MRAILFANGDLNPGTAVDSALRFMPESLCVAVDGGGRHLLALGLTPQVVIGDMDSLSEDDLARFAAQGAAIHRYPPAKDETDLELGLHFVAESGASWVRIVGAMGDRLDQTLANILLLTLPFLQQRDVRLVAGEQTAWVMPPGEYVLDGAVGDTLSLIPLGGDVSGVATEGLEYPLRDETLVFGPARGISNTFSGPEAVVRLRGGMLLAVQTASTSQTG